jgi:Protein of unknown function (DUF3606)
MADDKTKTAPQDARLINLNEVAYWRKKFGVSAERLAQAVRRVGHSAAAVEEEIKKYGSSER